MSVGTAVLAVFALLYGVLAGVLAYAIATAQQSEAPRDVQILGWVMFSIASTVSLGMLTLGVLALIGVMP
ncbi:hypothetical protein [Gryllotalpicola koreensis]|uniref:DUF4190 domain-containing protein n=1 Tax=Gryllotalpicola koreensis TaxID=993086 RepID=A0ABP8A262_9MICO